MMIAKHSRFAFAKIYKKTGSLKSGNAWHYIFFVNDLSYEGFRSTHVDYEVNLSDYFLVNFSYSNPNHSKLLYQYKLEKFDTSVIRKVWEKIPMDLLVNAKK